LRVLDLASIPVVVNMMSTRVADWDPALLGELGSGSADATYS
jgi:hypothetical protein